MKSISSDFNFAPAFTAALHAADAMKWRMKSDAEHLASGIAAVANTLNPEVVILGGGVSEAGESLRTKIEKAVLRRTLPAIRESLKLKMATLGNSAGWLGAGAFARMMLK